MPATALFSTRRTRLLEQRISSLVTVNLPDADADAICRYLRRPKKAKNATIDDVLRRILTARITQS